MLRRMSARPPSWSFRWVRIAPQQPARRPPGSGCRRRRARARWRVDVGHHRRLHAAQQQQHLARVRARAARLAARGGARSGTLAFSAAGSSGRTAGPASSPGRTAARSGLPSAASAWRARRRGRGTLASTIGGRCPPGGRTARRWGRCFRSCGRSGSGPGAAAWRAWARAFEHLLDQVDAAARAVELVAQQLVGGAGGGAEAAVHALAQDGLGRLAVGRAFEFGGGGSACRPRPRRAGGGAGAGAPASAARRPIRSAARPAASGGAGLRHATGATAWRRVLTAFRRRRRTRRRGRAGRARTRRPGGASMASPPSAAQGRFHRGARAGQAQHQHAVPPGAGRQRQRLAAPGFSCASAPRPGRIRSAGGAWPPAGSTFSDTSQITPSVPIDPASSARHVVAGHVLHHLAAEAQQLAAAVEQRGAQHVVAHAAGGWRAPARPARRPPCRPRCRAPEARRLERQALALARPARLPARPAACRRAR
jgi:hypothetical protein